MSISEGVRTELENIKAVLSGNLECHDFGGDDWCIVEFKKGTSKVFNGFDEFEPFEDDSKEIYKLMQDWLGFLLASEKNEIPGVVHPDFR